MGKRILFRVDAGGTTGLGHYFRSLNLARHLNARGHYVQFVHRPSSFWREAIANGLPFEEEELGLAEEERMLELLRIEKFDIFYVDAILEFSKEFIANARKASKIIFYQNISSSKTDADIFILPTIPKDKDFFKDFQPSVKIYQGLEFFLFHENIEQLIRKDSESAIEVRNVAIITGGSDPQNVLLRIYEMIDYPAFVTTRFNFYYGRDFMHQSLIPEKPGNRIRFLEFNHSSILDNDLLISIFSVCTYEFMSLGMPVITVAHQESNSQTATAVSDHTHGICHLGLIDDLAPKVLNQTLDYYVTDQQARTELVRNARKSIDLQGIERVIKIIEDV